MTDTLDYSKNYTGAPLNVKTNELEAVTVKGDIQADAGSIGTTEIANDAITSAKIAADAVGSSEIAADAVGSSEIAANAVGASEIADDAVNKAKLNTEEVTVTVQATATSGTGTVTADSQILGYYPAGNQDQFVESIVIFDTTLVITLAAAATADNIFKVVLLKA